VYGNATRRQLRPRVPGRFPVADAEAGFAAYETLSRALVIVDAVADLMHTHFFLLAIFVIL
jgi:hypothetical protein